MDTWITVVLLIAVFIGFDELRSYIRGFYKGDVYRIELKEGDAAISAQAPTEEACSNLLASYIDRMNYFKEQGE